MIARIVAAVIVCMASEQTFATPCDIKNIETFAKSFARAFQHSALASLDRTYCIRTPIKVIVKHSIGGESELNGETGEVQIGSFAELGSWLSKRQNSDGMPVAALWPFQGCSAGICTFGGNSANQQHNHLFLVSVEYTAKQSKVVVDSIVFEDGD